MDRASQLALDAYHGYRRSSRLAAAAAGPRQTAAAGAASTRGQATDRVAPKTKKKRGRGSVSKLSTKYKRQKTAEQGQQGQPGPRRRRRPPPPPLMTLLGDESIRAAMLMGSSCWVVPHESGGTEGGVVGVLGVVGLWRLRRVCVDLRRWCTAVLVSASRQALLGGVAAAPPHPSWDNDDGSRELLQRHGHVESLMRSLHETEVRLALGCAVCCAMGCDDLTNKCCRQSI
jgi:hypothetical protein|eukprot:COSAG01_NODE_4466_length_5000_cov_4.900224_6_plen_230_part_00